jgi:hypothetical protein
VGATVFDSQVLVQLDNEPEWWYEQHSDIHPTRANYSEVWNLYLEYAVQIKTSFPNVKIIGGVAGGWFGSWCSCLDGYGWSCPLSGPDYLSHGNKFYFPWLLEQVYSYSVSNGLQLIDYIDVHWYPYSLSDDTNELKNEQCLGQTRTWWDTTYVDVNGNYNPATNSKNAALIPNLQGWLSTYAPGLNIGVASTEWNFGPDTSNTAALAHAETWSIFAAQSVALAARFGGNADSGTPMHMALLMYRDFDGQGSKISGDSVWATVNISVTNVTAYARHNNALGILYITLFNKNLNGNFLAQINIARAMTAGHNAISSSCYSFQACPQCSANLTSVVSAPLGISGSWYQAEVALQPRSATLCVYKNIVERPKPSQPSSSGTPPNNMEAPPSGTFPNNMEAPPNTLSTLGRAFVDAPQTTPSSLSSSSNLDLTVGLAVGLTVLVLGLGLGLVLGVGGRCCGRCMSGKATQTYAIAYTPENIGKMHEEVL